MTEYGSNTMRTFNRSRMPGRSRRGISTMWVIGLLPALALGMVVLTDVANLWLSHIELKNALDAAALSGVKSWGEGSSTSQARLDAAATFGSNTIRGQVWPLDAMQGGCANGNVSSSGEIVLGSISEFSPANYAFDCSQTPGCVTGTFTALFAVETDPNGDTYQIQLGMGQAQDANRTYRIEQFTQTGGGGPLVLNSVELDLRDLKVAPSGGGSPVPDDGFFDLKTSNSNSDNNRGIGTPPGPGNSLIAINDVGVTPTFGFAGGMTSDEPRVMTVSLGTGIPSAAPGSNRFFWGTDTDYVGANQGAGGGIGAAVQDFGGEFGTDSGNAAGSDPFTTTGATVRIVVSGQTFVGTLKRVNENRSEVFFDGTVTSSGQAFGVRARKTIQVPSITCGLLGQMFGPFNVTAESYARYVCFSGNPQLIRINSYSCNCP